MMQYFLINKKGGTAFIVILTFLIFLLVFGIIIFMLSFVLNTFFDEFQGTGNCTTGTCANTIQKFRDAYRLYDRGMVLFVIGSIVGTAYYSLRRNSRTIMYLLFFIQSAFLGFISYFFSFIYITYVSEPVFLATTASFPLSILLLTNLHWIALALMFVASFTFFSKNSDESPRFLS